MDDGRRSELNADRTRTFARALAHTTNSYKFLWLLGLLDLIEAGTAEAPVDDLLISMVSRAWKLTRFYRLRLGHYDQLGTLAAQISERMGIPSNATPREVARTIRGHATLLSEVRRLGRYVPQRFLAPWFATDLAKLPDANRDRAITALAAARKNTAGAGPYSLEERHGERWIVLGPDWVSWARSNMPLLRAFAEREFAEYLQDRNPGSPSILRKVKGDVRRKLGRARRFWEPLGAKSGPLRDFYTLSPLHGAAVHFDHVLPWAFVAHDLLWNLVPTASSTNLAKGSQIPEPTYVRRLAEWQFDAIHAQPAARTDLVTDHAELLGLVGPRETLVLPRAAFLDRFEERFTPHLTAALNAGFPGGWAQASTD